MVRERECTWVSLFEMSQRLKMRPLEGKIGKMKNGHLPTVRRSAALPHHGTAVEFGAALPHYLSQQRKVFERWLTRYSWWRLIDVEIEHLVAHNGQRF
jgi:hypothetical protein